MTLCADCLEAGEAQRKAMEPREVKEGVVLLLRNDAFRAYVGDAPDLRMGDVIRVQLVAGAVPDCYGCENEWCEGHR